MKRRTSFLSLGALAIIFLTATSFLSVIADSDNTTDLDALLAFKSAIIDPENILQSNWSTSTSVCSWIGITCNIRQQRVAAIDLPQLGLIGTIPSQLGNLSFLIHLNLYNNSFHGNLPPELCNLRRLEYFRVSANNLLGEFPSWLGRLTKLQFLSMSYNRFSGPLLTALFNATGLETIYLNNNNFTGNVPQGFGSLQKLVALDMGFNQLGGNLPLDLFNISALEELSFTSNNLSGTLPVQICNHLPQLQGLYLHGNQLQGEIPSGIGNCSSLEILAMSSNNFSGNIPIGFSNLTNIREVSFLQNNLTGGLPQDFGNLLMLELIQFGINTLTGPIPPGLFNISTLQIIGLSTNNFSGDLPSTLGLGLPNLQGLYLGINQLSGFPLTSISNASSLVELLLNYNLFSGLIPRSLGNLRFLQTLALQVNNFSNEFPSGELSFLTSLTNCTELNTLRLSGNPLDGFLPFSVGNFSTSLAYFYLDSCGINGEIPGSIGNLGNLLELNLAGNDLNGIVPTAIKGLLNIQRVFLSNNNIEGPIPMEFCDLLNLGDLSLSNNILSGMVPSCIWNVSSLRYLDLSLNNLSSILPSSMSGIDNILQIDLSVNSFTGSLPTAIGNLKALTYLNLSMNRFSGEIPSTIGLLQNLQVLSLARNKFQGLIPDSMKNMFSLNTLDLSFNNLSGVMPSSLDELSNLKVFNVSYNRLTGPIPLGGPFKNFTISSFISDDGLCGADWLKPCQTSEHRSKKKKILLVLLAPGLAILMALAILLLIMRKWRRKFVGPNDRLLLEATTYQRVTTQELQNITDGFSESNLLGSGGFGSVYKGTHANGFTWAIKVFNLQHEGAFESFDRECEVLRCLRHRNLTKIVSVCSQPDFKALVLEYMPNGNLETWLYSNDHILDFMPRLDIMIDVASGLEYLHHGYSVPVVHCDLKPSNILLDQDMVGHLTDFGITRLLGDDESVVQTKTIATFGYIAPEYGQNGLVSTRCDVYSFGITLMETFTRRRPNDEMFSEKATLRSWIQESLRDHSINQVVDANLFELEEGLVKEKMAFISLALELALKCTVDAPAERINMKDALVALKKIKFQFLQTNNKS